MDRTVFADHVVISDLDLRFSFRRERKILRRRANNRALSDEITSANHDISLNDNVRVHDGLITNHRLRPDYRERTDLNIGAELRARIDNRRRMNLQSTPASLKLK